MKKKIGCKKCGSRNYSFGKIVKKNKNKYFRTCKDCGNIIRIYPDRAAYSLYLKFYKYEALQKCKDITPSNEYLKALKKTESVLKKDYKYVYNNLQLFFNHIFSNDEMKIAHNAFPADILNVIKNYSMPLQESDYQNIINELGRITKIDENHN